MQCGAGDERVGEIWLQEFVFTERKIGTVLVVNGKFWEWSPIHS